MKKTKYVSCVLTAIVLFGSLHVYAADMGNFQHTNSYLQGQFTDVKTGAWYTDDVACSVETGLMNGKSAASFDPDGTVTVAEAVTMAARIRNIYNDGHETIPVSQDAAWYTPYTDYAIRQRIIQSGDFAKYDTSVSRGQFAYIMAHSLPGTELAAINSIAALPDVDKNTSHKDSIFLLYNAGVLTGSDKYGAFSPDKSLTRAEAAAIINRITDKSKRKAFAIDHIYSPAKQLLRTLTDADICKMADQVYIASSYDPYRFEDFTDDGLFKLYVSENPEKIANFKSELDGKYIIPAQKITEYLNSNHFKHCKLHPENVTSAAYYPSSDVLIMSNIEPKKEIFVTINGINAISDEEVLITVLFSNTREEKDNERYSGTRVLDIFLDVTYDGYEIGGILQGSPY